jgi:hypothetical protein
MAVGLYSPEGAEAAGAAVLMARLPRARPEPRVLPNVPNSCVLPAAAWAPVVSAGAALADAPDVSGSVIGIFFVLALIPIGGELPWFYLTRGARDWRARRIG